MRDILEATGLATSSGQIDVGKGRRMAELALELARLAAGRAGLRRAGEPSR